MIKGVFFDLYGTLLVMDNPAEGWERWLDRLYDQARRCGYRRSRDELAQRCEGLFTRPEPAANDGLTIYESRIAALYGELGLRPAPDDVRAAAEATVNAWNDRLRLDEDTREVLSRLGERRRLALITNFDHPPFIPTVLARMGLDGFFEHVTISGQVGVKKPDPRIFAPALGATGLSPDEVVYVGDSVEDVEGAVAAGIAPIRIERGGVDRSGVIRDYRPDRTAQQLADEYATDQPARTIASLSELVSVVDELRIK
ncbi:MAG: HAD family hydrolase [Phycisphaerae bacterium]|nr:HAD family hydrolase [Phycisphaerae bacterium]